MRKILSCEFNPDTACVELCMEDGTLLSIDCTAVENEVANSMYQRSELDWLIYNDPLSYAELILNGDRIVSKSSNKENSVRLMAKKIRQKQHSKGCASDGFLHLINQSKYNSLLFFTQS